MKFNVNGVSVNILLPQNKFSKNKIPLILLHGFTGSSEDWIFLIDKLDERVYPIAIDLPGHGKTEISRNSNDYNIDFIINTLNRIMEHLNLPKTILLGYSMGGRVVEHFTIQNVSKVKAVILESTTPGIKNENERDARYKSDLDLAEFILKEGVEKFINYWMNLPLFEPLKNIPPEEYQKIIYQKLNNDPIGLSNSLRGFSTGKMESMWSSLFEINHPTLLITGKLDNKYTDIARDMNKQLTNSKHVILENTGHNTHLEKPKEFIKLVNNFIANLI